ncbi:hypothetical protein [Roseivivax sp. CAU 1761]
MPESATSATLIMRGATKSSVPVNEYQAQLLANLLRELIDEHRFEAELNAVPELDLAMFRDLPAYGRLLIGAYACGFVCDDLAPDSFDINCPPRELRYASFASLRAFMHVLLRAERWNDGVFSPIHAALMAGHLEVIQDRLFNDQELYEPY